MNDIVELFTVGIKSFTDFTCHSVAGFVLLGVAGNEEALGNIGAVENVFVQLIVCVDVKSTRFDKSTISAIASQLVQFHTTFVQASNFGVVVCACTTLYISHFVGEAGKSAYEFTCHL